MKQFLLLPFVSMGMLSFNTVTPVEKKITPQHCLSFIGGNDDSLDISTQSESGGSRMSAAVFKAQQYCRVELKDFDFDAHFTIVSVTVYFSGANFPNLTVGKLTSSSLKPISSLMARCGPGSVIIFDDVKVMGPDNTLRTIPGESILLY
jgi:hypothetical protein